MGSWLDDVMVEARRRLEEGEMHAATGASVSIPDAAEFPKLVALMGTLPKGASGFAKTGAVTLFVQEGRLTACVSFPAAGLRAFVALDCLGDCLVILEKALSDGDLNWGKEKKKASNGRF